MFMLIYVNEREIFKEEFKTKFGALRAMLGELRTAVTNYDDKEWENREDFDSEWSFDKDRAWCNYRENRDWEIVKINLDI